jgi:hypothetical protein
MILLVLPTDVPFFLLYSCSSLNVTLQTIGVIMVNSAPEPEICRASSLLEISLGCPIGGLNGRELEFTRAVKISPQSPL